MSSTWSDHLEVVTEAPPNAGTPLSEQTGRLLAPQQVFVRSNFVFPEVDVDHWVVRFHLGETIELGVEDLRRHGETSVDVVLECAGNGRTLMQPAPGGTPWALGAASTTSFQGVWLRSVLEELDVPRETVELVFTGIDRGRVPHDGDVPYAFSLGIREAVHGSALLAWGMADHPLTVEHGAPVRLVVPGQYAMKSVKWLSDVRAVREPFAGHFVRKYRYFSDDHEPEGSPVGPIQVRSLIASPEEGARCDGPRIRVQGVAWSDGSSIERVDVSADDASTWTAAELEPSDGRFGPTAWSVEVDAPEGRAVIVARATDVAGRTQPLSPRWNGNGYANNVVQRVTIEVV